MSVISHSLAANLESSEIPALKKDSPYVTFKKFMAYIDNLHHHSPAEKKMIGYQRLVKKEAFNSLGNSQQRAILQALGFVESEIKQVQKDKVKERLDAIARAYKKYSTKTNPYTETEIHQMLRRLGFKDREIEIARRYVREEREQKVCKLYEKYSQLIHLKTREPINEEELVTLLKELGCTEAEIRMVKKKNLASIPTPPPIKRSEKSDDLSQVDPVSTHSIGQTLLNFFFSVGKLILAVTAALALLLGLMVLAVFVWPLADLS